MSSASKADHRKNWLLAALEPEDLAYLEPHLEIVRLPKGRSSTKPVTPSTTPTSRMTLS